MSIKLLRSADFTPISGNYKTLEPFRYWCQKVLPLVYDDSLSYYELLCKVVDYLNKTMEDVETLHSDVTNLRTTYEKLQEYVNNYFSTLDVQKEINNKLDEMVKNGELDAIINHRITLNNTSIAYGNCLYDYFYDYTSLGSVQGGCYIGNDNIVFYLLGDKTNTGKLISLNINTGAINWISDIEGGHANTITYNQDNNSLYITYCFGYENMSTLSNTIIRVDLSDHTRIAETIDLSVPCYSLVYDNITKEYYAITARGTEEGVANKVTVFNTEFNIVRTFLIKDYPATKTHSSVQGLTFANNGILCVLGYQASNKCVLLCNTDGETILYKHIEQFFNGYRQVGEPEFLTYDWDNKKYYLGYNRVNTGFSGHIMCGIAELCVDSTIVYSSFKCSPGDMNLGQIINLSFNHKEGIIPAPKNLTTGTTLNCLDDCFMISHLNNVLCYIHSNQNIGNYMAPSAKVSLFNETNDSLTISSLDGYALEYIEFNKFTFTGNVQITPNLTDYSMYCTPGQTRILNECTLNKPYYIDRGAIYLKDCTFNFDGFSHAFTHSKIYGNAGKIKLEANNIIQNVTMIKSFAASSGNTFDLSEFVFDNNNVNIGVSISNTVIPVMCKKSNVKDYTIALPLHTNPDNKNYIIYTSAHWNGLTVTFDNTYLYDPVTNTSVSVKFGWGVFFYLMP